MLVVSLAVDFLFVARGDGLVLEIRLFLVSVFLGVTSLADDAAADAERAASCFLVLSAAEATAVASSFTAVVEVFRF